MNNIDKRALREAADSVIQKYGSEWFETGRQLCTVHKSKIELIAATNPAAVLALLDDLESQQIFQQAFFRQSLMYDVVAEAYEEAKEQIAKDVEIKARLCRESNSLFDRLRAAEKRIAELEARTVTLPEALNSYGGMKIYRPKDVIEAIRAAGIGVKGE